MVTITGKVIKGQQFGRILGFPTANLERRQYVRSKIKIRLGVYGGYAELMSGKKYKAAIVIGPIDKTGLPKIETHLIGFKGNLYGKYLSIYPSTYLRPFKKFKKTEDLKRRIKQDILKIKDVLK